TLATQLRAGDQAANDVPRANETFTCWLARSTICTVPLVMRRPLHAPAGDHSRVGARAGAAVAVVAPRRCSPQDSSSLARKKCPSCDHVRPGSYRKTAMLCEEIGSCGSFTDQVSSLPT